MLDLFVGKDTAVITMLLLFVTALLTKRVVPWYVYEDVLRKLTAYEELAPSLKAEIDRLIQIVEGEPNKMKSPQVLVRPRTKKVQRHVRKTT